MLHPIIWYITYATTNDVYCANKNYYSKLVNLIRTCCVTCTHMLSFNAFPIVLWYIVAFLYRQHISICYDDVLMLSSFFDATLLHLFVYNTFLYVMIIAAFQRFLPSVDSLLMGKSDQNIKASLFYCCFSRIPTKC